jgi:hypothetical protein
MLSKPKRPQYLPKVYKGLQTYHFFTLFALNYIQIVYARIHSSRAAL